MEQSAARSKNGRPLRNLLSARQDGFVVAVLSHVFRDGMGIFMVKLSDYRFLASGINSRYTAHRPSDGRSPCYLLIQSTSFFSAKKSLPRSRRGGTKRIRTNSIGRQPRRSFSRSTRMPTHPRSKPPSRRFAWPAAFSLCVSMEKRVSPTFLGRDSGCKFM